MASRDQNGSLPLLGGAARNLAALMMLIGALICFGMAFYSSWPLGPSYVDEGSITEVRLAIATLVAGQVLAFGFLGFFVFDILVRVKRLSQQQPKSPDSES